MVESYVNHEKAEANIRPATRRGGEEYVIIPIGQTASDEFLTLKYFVPNTEKKGNSSLKGIVKIAKDGTITSELSPQEISTIFVALTEPRNRPPTENRTEV